MSGPAALIAARAAIAALWPGANDITGVPFDAPEDDLPTVRLTRTVEQSEPVEMGSDDVEETGTLSLILTVSAPVGVDLEAGLQACGDAAQAAIAADAGLAAEVVALTPAGRDTETAAGRGRIGRITLTWSIVTTGPEPGAASPAEFATS